MGNGLFDDIQLSLKELMEDINRIREKDFKVLLDFIGYTYIAPDNKYNIEPGVYSIKINDDNVNLLKNLNRFYVCENIINVGFPNDLNLLGEVIDNLHSKCSDFKIKIDYKKNCYICKVKSKKHNIKYKYKHESLKTALYSVLFSFVIEFNKN